MAFRAQEDSRRLTLPQKPEDFDFVLSKNFKPPEGIEFKLNPDDPLAAQARAFALKHGMSKEGFSELLDLYAAGQIGNEQGIANAKKAEVDKLGVNGVARKTAVDTFIASVPGVSEDMAKAFSRFTFTAAQVEVMEKVMAHMRSQGQGRPSNTGREPPEPHGALPPEQFDRLSNAEKLDYVRRFDQSKMPANPFDRRVA